MPCFPSQGAQQPKLLRVPTGTSVATAVGVSKTFASEDLGRLKQRELKSRGEILGTLQK